MQNTKFKLALIQMKGEPSNEENINNAIDKIKEAVDKGAQIVVLPEMFSCPYKASNFPIFAQKDGEANWTLLSQAAAKNNIYLVAGAKLIIVPGAFNMTSGPNWWEIMFRTRATDNQVYMAGCSPARDENASYVAWGHSIVVDPFGKILQQLDEKENILYQEIDLAEVERFRQQYKILKSRRLDLYELKEK